MAINWTPWFNVPMHRRLEVFSLFFMLCHAIFFGPIYAIYLIYKLIFGNIYWRIVCASYFAFYLYDIRNNNRGGRGAGFAWVRGCRIFKYILNYFPIDLVRTVDLSPDRNYLICIFPHGFLSFGAALNFGTSHSKWEQLFPALRPKLTSLNGNYYVPIARELFLSCGMASASANSLTALLQQSNDTTDKSNRDGFTSNAVGLIVGGIREQGVTYPDSYQLVIAKRRGFVRIALQTGVSLVPAISFGENNVYDIVDMKSTAFGRFVERWCSRYTRQFPPLYCGRGFLQYDYGLLPRRRPITTVIGAPIHLIKSTNPSKDEIDKVHHKFCVRLSDLFETHKSKYIDNSDDIHLEFV